jgi:hypothetical protein
MIACFGKTGGVIMRRGFLRILFAGAVLQFAVPAFSATDVPVPATCTPQVNQKLADLIASQQTQAVDNIMVCGITASASRAQHGGPHGDHEIFPLRVTMPDGNVRLVEVVSNDDLDGPLSAGPNTAVFAYGQAFFPTKGHFIAGVHDVHCATHRGANNGWIVVDGQKHPRTCSR